MRISSFFQDNLLNFLHVAFILFLFLPSAITVKPLQLWLRVGLRSDVDVQNTLRWNPPIFPSLPLGGRKLNGFQAWLQTGFDQTDSSRKPSGPFRKIMTKICWLLLPSNISAENFCSKSRVKDSTGPHNQNTWALRASSLGDEGEEEPLRGKPQIEEMTFEKSRCQCPSFCISFAKMNIQY